MDPEQLVEELEPLIDDLQLTITQLHGKIPIEVMFLPRPATDYKGCYPKYFEKHLVRLLETDDYVHLFAGSAKTGYRIDCKEDTIPDLLADVHDLSMIQDAKFPGGMADPPYDKKFAERLYGTPYPRYTVWTAEMARIVKPGGLIGIMHNYTVPLIPGCKYEKFVIILIRNKQFPKIVTIMRKNE